MSAKISALPNMTPLTGAEFLTGLQGGANSNATPNQIATFVGSATTQVFAGNYAGAAPGFSPTASVAIAFDTSDGTQWNWYSGVWN